MKDNTFAAIKYEWFQDKELNYSMIMILGVLNSLCRRRKYCWATNSFIGQVINLNETNVSKYINQLQKLGYIIIKSNEKTRLKDEDGNYIFRNQRIIKLTKKGTVDFNFENEQGYMKSRTPEVHENMKQIDNIIINNLSNNNISKDISIISATGAPETKDELNNNTNTNMGNEVVLEENVFEKDFLEPAAPVEEKPKKRKQGVNLAPYIDTIKEYYTAYKDISDALTNYVIQVNRQRAVWTLEEWHEVLDYLYNSTSISIPGTKGRKVMVNQVLEKIEFALRGNGTTPYMDFKNEPPSANKQNFVPSFIKKGY